MGRKHHKNKGKSSKDGKLKHSLKSVIRKVFDKNPGAELTHKQICHLIDVKDGALRKLAYQVLEDLVKERFLIAVGHAVYQQNQGSKNYLQGVIEITARGAGFVIIDGQDKDVYISPKDTSQALHGDVVKIQITREKSNRLEGQVVEVISRERTQFVGVIEMHEKFAFLIPDNQRFGTDIYIPKEKLNGAKNGDRVLGKITVWPKTADSPFGEVLEILSGRNENDTEMISILCAQGINYVFPQEVLAEAETVTMDLDPHEIDQRRDFRSVLTFTIDPVDAKDFDDALSFLRLENGNIELGVHIADVSHYVRPGTAMDEEALKRSNSVYLVDRVVPMLPEQLSNMACSLRPHEDKYSFSAVFELTKEGEVVKEWFGKTVIHSDRRFSYEEAQEIIEGKSGDHEDEIRLLDKIAKTFRKKRLKQGALSIESEEMRFVLDDKSHPIAVNIKTSKDAHKLIEEFMLLANKHVALHMQKHKAHYPFVYRVHDKPDEAKLEVFKTFISKFGYDVELGNLNKVSQNINTLLNDIRYKNEYSLIQTMAIRSMAKATYEPTNIGHYGLAFEHYTHFTSPIRRYADLIVHRILWEQLNKINCSYKLPELDGICKLISRNERKATDAERESQKYFQTQYVLDHIGEEFEGTVSGLAEFGMFVKMDENHCEGMVPMQDIPGDRFYYDSEKFAIVGGRTKKEYNFGDRVKVRIFEVIPRKRQIDLELVV